MKPVSITLEGLASFTEPQTLDFTSLSSLFCISGSTGSGKSTILDAIIIALYGRSGRDGNVRDYINKRTQKAKINFVFSAGNDIYEVVREFLGGEKNLSKASLKKNGVLVSEKSTEINSMIEGAVGLNAEDFTQVVILEQGQFNKFLSATKSVRAKTVGNIFRLNRFKDAYTKFSMRKSKIDAEIVAKDRQISAYEEDTVEREKQLEEIITSAATRKSELDEKIKAAEQLKSNFDAVRMQAERESLICEKIKAEEKKISELQKALEEARSEEGALEAKKSESLQWTNSTERIKSVLAKAEIFSSAELSRKEKNISDKRSEYNSAAEKAEAAQKAYLTAQKDYDEFKEQYDVALKSVVKFMRTDDYVSERESLRERLLWVKGKDAEISACRKELEAANKRYEQEKRASEVKSAAIGDILAAKKVSEEKIELLNIKISALREKRESIGRENAAAFLASTLKEGDVCPVCGGKITHLSCKAQEDIAAQDALIKAAEDELKKCVSEFNAAEKTHAALSAEKFAADKSTLEYADKIKTVGQKIEASERERSELLAGGDYAELESLLATADPHVLGEKSGILKAAESEKDKTAEAVDNIVIEGKRLREEKDEYFDKMKNIFMEYYGDQAAAQRAADDFDNTLSALKKQAEELAELSENYADKVAKAAQNTKNAETSLSAATAALEAEKRHITGVVFDSAAAQKNESDLTELKTQSEQCVSASAEAKTNLASLRKNMEKKALLLAERKALADKSADLALIAEMLKGDRFLEFVSEEYIARFTDTASDIMAQLTGGKYNLLYKSEEGAYYVKDFLSSGEERKIATLSGGENFLASLSIAIAISREISTYSDFEFFFLDEGFGTLDDDSVDTVLEALNALSSQTMVGIITHCAALTENIPDCVTVKHATETEGSKITRGAF